MWVKVSRVTIKSSLPHIRGRTNDLVRRDC